jgi:hypothetical protein
MVTEMPTGIKKMQQELEDARKAAQAPTPEVPVVETPNPSSEAVPIEPELQPTVALEAAATDVPEPQDVGKTEPAPQPTDNLEQKLRLLEHKLSVLQGKYDAEVPGEMRKAAKLAAENKALKEQVEAAKASAKSEKTPPKPTPVRPADVSDDEVKAYYSPTDIEDFGMEFLKKHIAVAKSVQAAAPSPTDPNEERIQSMEDRLEQQAHDAYLGDLTKVVSNWKEITESPEWTDDYLAEIDEKTGLSNHTLLQDAYEKYDVGRTAALFKEFAARQPVKTTAVPTAGREVPRPGPAPVGSTKPKNTMTLAEYIESMNKLPTLGLSPMQLLERRKELEVVWREGRVVD